MAQTIKQKKHSYDSRTLVCSCGKTSEQHLRDWLSNENDDLQSLLEKIKKEAQEGLDTDGAHHKDEALETITKLIK